MSISEFRYNKKRKHYAYLFKTIGLKRKNILITSKPFVIKHKNGRSDMLPLLKEVGASCSMTLTSQA